jgi:signal transduction histidine kinase
MLWFSVTEVAITGSLFLYIVTLMGKPGFSFIILSILTVAYMGHRNTWWWTIPVTILVYPALGSYLGKISLEEYLDALMEVALFYGIGYCFNRIVFSYQVIRRQNQTLEQYAKQIEQLTLLEERNRMARELHDTVGHVFTTAIVGMDAVIRLIDTSPETAKANLQELRSIAHKGLEEIRHFIHHMSQNQISKPLLSSITQIANEFAFHTNTKVTVRSAELKEPHLPEAVKLALIRCLQESLTNAKRHGQAQSVQVELTYHSRSIEMSITDDGTGFEPTHEGFGIRSMKERLRGLQGTLQITSKPGEGTRVICTVPLGGDWYEDQAVYR